MEDYDVFNEMQNLKSKKVILIIEDDEDFIFNYILDSDYEMMPFRFSYNLNDFSKKYVEKTKKLFSYYYNENNLYNNELLKLKKHFVHYQRFPMIAYIPKKCKYFDILIRLCNDLKIEYITEKKDLIKKLKLNKVFFIDCDSTLKTSLGRITLRTKKAILKNKEIGNKIFICTARPRYQAIEIVNESGADEIIITSNGAEIFDINNNDIIKDIFIKKEDIINLLNIAYLENVRLILSSKDFDYVTKVIRNPHQKILDKEKWKEDIKKTNIKQCMFIDKNPEKITNLKKYIINNYNELYISDESNPNINYGEYWFSISNVFSSKGNAVVTLMKELNIQKNNIIAIGNDKNDLSMFKVADLGVCVDNADEYIKKQADLIIESNNNDGVAKFLERYLF